MAEEWRPIRGFEGAYQVSNFGRVRSLDRTVKYSNGRVLQMKGRVRSTPSVKGYLSLFLSFNGRKTFAYVAHLVADVFIGPRPSGKEVAHGDGDGSNARLENLRYATPVENDADKIAHGTRPEGIKNGHAKLTDADILDIRRRRASGERGIDLAHQYDVSSGHISTICKRRTWRHI